MNSFIHTYELTQPMFLKDWELLKQYYSAMPVLKNHRHFQKQLLHLPHGVQILMRIRNEKERKYALCHGLCEIAVIITPHKLVGITDPAGKITEPELFAQALSEMLSIIAQIEGNTTVDLSMLRLSRVDLTVDVSTPNDVYTREMIDLARIYPLPYGFERPDEDDICQNGLSSLFYRSNNSLFAKIYDKKAELHECGQNSEILQEKAGVLRYEITLTRKFLRKLPCYSENDILVTLMGIHNSSEEILADFWSGIFGDYANFSAPLLKKYLHKMLGSKEKHISDMLTFSMLASSYKKIGLPLDRSLTIARSYSEKQSIRIRKSFAELGISPITTDERCPLIPSVQNQLHGLGNPSFYNFAKRNTRGKELWKI